jgi:hypothetical protein
MWYGCHVVLNFHALASPAAAVAAAAAAVAATGAATGVAAEKAN